MRRPSGWTLHPRAVRSSAYMASRVKRLAVDGGWPIATFSPAERDQRPGQPGTQTHRLLRRGIPFGSSSRSTPAVPVNDQVDRGLLFMAYMTSIADQFEFVTQDRKSTR